jgi:programmed cell death protein 5
MSELDELRQKRLRQLQAMQQQGQQQAIQQQLQEQQMEEQINLIMRQIMSPEARDRLANIRMARPEFARQVEILLIQLYQGGRLKSLSDEQFKALLTKISGTKREPKIQMR